MNTLDTLLKILASNCTERQCYAVCVAFCAAEKFLKDHPEEFKMHFGTSGKKVIHEFSVK